MNADGQSVPLVLCVLGPGAAARDRALQHDLPPGAQVVVDEAASVAAVVQGIGPATGCDVVLVPADAHPATGWLDALRAVARRDPTVATVTAGPIVLLAAPALTLVGLDPDKETVPAVVADFVERSTGYGFVHAADSVVRAPGRGERMSVTLDVRAVGTLHGGTQVHALELAAALARTGRVRLRAVVPPDLDPIARESLTRHDVELLAYADAAARPPDPTALVHRPNQISTVDDLRLLQPLGRRLVVTQQDLLTYRIADYSPTPDAWGTHRDATREALGTADHVVFFSAYVREQALADELVDADRSTVVAIGTDHAEVTVSAIAERPPAVSEAAPFLLCLGTDLRHKNRPFALRLTAALRAEGWRGRLVLAGPHAAHGSSRDAERATILAEALDPHVVDLGPVSPAQRNWLLEHAAALVYPSVSEGFGLIPFEAARAGVPCLFAAQGPLAELLPEATAALRPWDVQESVRRALPLLTAGAAREQHVGALRAVADRYTWDASAAALLDVYERAHAAPAWPAAALSRRLREAELSAARLEHMLHAESARHAALIDAVGEWGLQLVGPDGIVPPEERELLTRLMHHRRITGMLLGTFSLGRRMARTGRAR